MTELKITDAVVGISISESPDLVQYGLGEIHVRHAFIEVVRHVLAAGGSIAYGGDFRPRGYTEALFDLIRTYDRHDRPGPERVLSFLAWPIWVDLRAEDRASLRPIATVHQVPAPPGAPESLAQSDKRSPLERMWFSRSLTAMREEMTAALSARLVLGGQVAGHQGLYPGIAEEAALAIRARVPVFPVGGFGGCARAIVAAMDGDYPYELTLEFQLENTDGYSELVEVARSYGNEIDYEKHLVAVFQDAGTEGLDNGLNADENRHLATTDDVDEIVSLVLRGLRKLA